MTGIEQILLGFRDEYGIVRQVQPLLIKDIETRAVRFYTMTSINLYYFCALVLNDNSETELGKTFGWDIGIFYEPTQRRLDESVHKKIGILQSSLPIFSWKFQ